jgi:lipocalin
MLHGCERVTTGLGQKFIYPSRAFVEDYCCVEDKNEECMRIYGKAILTDSSKKSYLKNAVFGIPEYKFALATLVERV